MKDIEFQNDQFNKFFQKKKKNGKLLKNIDLCINLIQRYRLSPSPMSRL